MPRFLPQVDHRCHVCGTVFVFHTDWRAEACPACEAPVRHSYAADVGRAKELIVRHYRKRGAAAIYLEAECRTPEEVDAYVALATAMVTALVTAMDYRGWLAQERVPSRTVKRAHADAASGRLALRLAEEAAPVRAALEAHRAKHLAIFESKRRLPPAKRDPGI